MNDNVPQCGAPRWSALVEDQVVPLPQQQVRVSVIKAQRGLADDMVLVRDHNSPDDVHFTDDAMVDLADGNVFYALRRCDVIPRNGCTAPPKLAWFVDDRAEIVTRAEQTGSTILQLFSLPENTRLFRDYERPRDELIEPNEAASFRDGPVFYTRESQGRLKITVNSRVFTEEDGVKPEMTGLEIATLVYPENPQETCVWLTSGEKREIPLDRRIKITGCEVFDVVRKGVTGGFEATRIEREVELIRASGAKVSVVSAPNAVVYHDLGMKAEQPVARTDVLVLIPGGYPGQMLDGAFLPEGSPLLGKVKGSPQSTFVTALERRWQLVSYHPHNGGGAETWNPTRHGFHTYLGEVLSWLYDVA